MDNETAARLLKRARYSAGKFWRPDEAEDIAQEVLLKYLKNPESKQTVDQAVIDWLRQNGGRTRGGARRIMLFDCLDPDEKERLSSICDSARSNRSELQSFERYIHSLKTQDRCIAVLYFCWGLTESEIGYCFGVSESRISQRFTAIQTRIRSGMAKTEYREDPKIRQAISTQDTGHEKGTPEIEGRLAAIQTAAGKITARLERIATCGLAQEEPLEMENNYETGFDPWLT